MPSADGPDVLGHELGPAAGGIPVADDPVDVPPAAGRPQAAAVDDLELAADRPAGVVTGEVLAAGLRTPVAAVDVVAVGLGLGATTDAHGRYSLRLPPGEHELVVAAPAFKPAREIFSLLVLELWHRQFADHSSDPRSWVKS